MTASAHAHNPLRQKRGKRKIRKVIHVLPEGQTERDYLAMDAIQAAVQSGERVALKLVKGHKGQTDPASLVRQMKTHLRKEDFRSDDEAWLVIDVDEWTDGQIACAIQWESSDSRHHLAISNPKFELFLLMHYCDTRGCVTPVDVDKRLRRYLPDYKKRLSHGQFSLDQVAEAVSRSRGCDRSKILGNDMTAGTEVGELISRLLGSAGDHGRA